MLYLRDQQKKKHAQAAKKGKMMRKIGQMTSRRRVGTNGKRRRSESPSPKTPTLTQRPGKQARERTETSIQMKNEVQSTSCLPKSQSANHSQINLSSNATQSFPAPSRTAIPTVRIRISTDGAPSRPPQQPRPRHALLARLLGQRPRHLGQHGLQQRRLAQRALARDAADTRGVAERGRRRGQQG